MKVKERKSNFELLRIITMLMIVTMHVLDYSGIFLSENILSYNFIVSNIINGFSIVAVNCYILITGYFGYKQEFKKNKLVKLYTQVIVISIFTSLIFWIFKLENININNLVKTFMPIISQSWWFISVYFVLYIITPYINKLIEVLNKNELEKMILIGLIIFVIWPSISAGDLINPISEDGGYGLYNFILLYIIGAYIGKYKDTIKVSKYNFFFIYVISMTLLVCINLGLTYLMNKYIAKLSYDFILTYIGSISLFVFFKELNFKSTIINFVSSLTLGVYLIHEHPFVRNLIAKVMNESKIYLDNSFILYLVLIVVGVYCVTSILEFIRIKIFKLVLEYKNKIIDKGNCSEMNGG